MFKFKFKRLKFFSLAYLTLLIQSALLPLVFNSNSKPDLILILVIFYALYHGPKQGMIIGMGFGLCVDILSGGALGLNVFILGFIGYFTGFLTERVYRDHFLTMIVVPFCASLVCLILLPLVTGNFYQTPSFRDQLAYVLYTSGISYFFLTFLKNQIISKTYILSRI